MKKKMLCLILVVLMISASACGNEAEMEENSGNSEAQEELETSESEIYGPHEYMIGEDKIVFTEMPRDNRFVVESYHSNYVDATMTLAFFPGFFMDWTDVIIV